MKGSGSGDGMLGKVSLSMFWNATLLPAITIANLAAAIILRRSLGLDSGLYDVLIGLVNASLAYSSFGIPVTLTQFVPVLERRQGRRAVAGFIRRVFGLRLGVLAVVCAGLTLGAATFARVFQLGRDGATLVFLVAALVLFRGLTDLAVRSLQSLLRHLAANLVQLVNALLTAGALAVTLLLGFSMPGILTGLALAAVAVTIGSTLAMVRGVEQVPEQVEATGDDTVATTRGWHYWRFALFMYTFDLSNTFASPAFASPLLGAVSAGSAAVALFNVAFQVPMMVVVVILSGFQGLYRPMFAGIFADGDLDRLRTGFAEVSKVQSALLIPAGLGLGIMLADFIPLLFDEPFAQAVPMARILCAFLFLESLFNLGNIVLSVDHRYAAVLGAQGLRIAAAPVFVLFAVRGNLIMAAVAFGAGRLAAVAVGHVLARRRYAVRFPWLFAAKVTLPALAMAIPVAIGQARLPGTWPVALGLSAAGAMVFILGLRWLRVLGPREIDLIRRARLPGKSLIIGLLVADGGGED